MGLKSLMKNLTRKKNGKKKTENILVLLMQTHIESYPHSYFLRKGPREIEFRRR